MDWKTQAVVLFAEISCGFIFGRFSIPFFRKIKTGKLELYIGDRLRKDGSEPKFGGAVIFITVLLGIAVGSACMNINSDSLTRVLDVRQVICAVMFCGILLTAGLFEDYQKETKKGIGMKKRYLYLLEFVASAVFIVLLRLFGFESAEVLLPFRMGYVDLGVWYIPLTALLMTLIINITLAHDCQNGVTETGIDGLCTLSVMIGCIGLASGMSAANGHDFAHMLCICTAGGCSALLFWSLSPSKIYLGQSGAMLLGGLLCCITVFSGLHIAALLALLAPIADGICAVLQRAVFAKSKKLLFKGASLHEHLKNIGWGDYRIMCADIIVQAIGCAGAIAFIVYESKIVI